MSHGARCVSTSPFPTSSNRIPTPSSPIIAFCEKVTEMEATLGRSRSHACAQTRGIRGHASSELPNLFYRYHSESDLTVFRIACSNCDDEIDGESGLAPVFAFCCPRLSVFHSSHLGRLRRSPSTRIGKMAFKIRRVCP